MTQSLPPLCTELAYLADSACYLEAIEDLPWPVFLDSGQRVNDQNARYDMLAADPYTTLQCRGELTTISYYDGQEHTSTEDPFELLQMELDKTPKCRSAFPFSGGAIGYFGYDLGRRIESLPSTAADAEQLPEMAVGLYDWVIITDHHLKQCWLVSHVTQAHTRKQWLQILERLQHPASHKPARFKVNGELHCNLNNAEYAHAFQQIKQYIKDGDCYQVNLAKRFEIQADGDPWIAYQQLRKFNSAPFSAYFKSPHAAILSSSPERLLQMHDRQIETKPIKGTRPRDLNDPVQDQLNAEALQQSLKDRAENLMIVDLLRNDLGKVCVPGSIRVPKPFALETFATVHHLVSTITGELAKEHTAVSLLRACFPGGSITGAPKLRAMQIIEQLEPNRRGIYCGSIAYIGFDGNMDSNITIRTLVFSDDRLRFWAGGGIVADSELEAEHQEVLDKAAAMLNVVESLR